MNKEEILRSCGLSENEATVYLASLVLGGARVVDIAKKAKLLRTTTYEVLRVLIEKGLVGYVIKSGVKYFEAADPSVLVSVLDERKKSISSILPELRTIKKMLREKPKVEFYEGKEGLKSILDDILASNEKELLTLSSAKVFDLLTYYFPNWIRRRAKKKMFCRTLQERVKIIEEFKRLDKKEYREIRFLPSGFRINTMTQIYGNKVAILTFREEEPVGVLIENEDIANTQRAVFNVLWEFCK